MKNRITPKIIFISLLLVIILLIISIKMIFLLQSALKENSPYQFCIIPGIDKSGEFARLVYKKNRFLFNSHRNGVFVIPEQFDHNKSKQFIPLLDKDILSFWGYRFQYRIFSPDYQNVTICNQRVENIVRTGTSRPFYIALDGGGTNLRNIVIIPYSEAYVQQLRKESSQDTLPGSQLLKIMPPLPEKIFLPYQTSGYRIQARYPNLFSIQRNHQNILLKPQKEVVLQNGDIINLFNDIRIKFCLEQKVVTETVDLNQHEKRIIGNSDAKSHIKRINRNKYGVFIKLIRLEEPSLINCNIQPVAWLERCKDTKQRLPRIPLSLRKTNIIVSQKSAISFSKPSGIVPDKYIDIQTVNNVKQFASNESLTLTNNVINISNEIFLRYPKVKELVNISNQESKPAGVLFWGDLYHDDNRTVFLTSRVNHIKKDSKLTLSEIGITQPLWFISKSVPTDWPNPKKILSLKPSCYRPDLIPKCLPYLPPSQLKTNWIWDNEAWNYMSVEKETRYATCVFRIHEHDKQPELLKWHLLTPATTVSGWLNGKKISFKQKGPSLCEVKLLRALIHSSQLSKETNNILALKLDFSIKNQTYEDKDPFVCMTIRIDDTLLTCNHPDWEVSVSNTINWWHSSKNKSMQWLSSQFIQTRQVFGFVGSDDIHINHNSDSLEGMWLNEDIKSIKDETIRYFRIPIHIQSHPKVADLKFYSSGSVTLYMNNKKLIHKKQHIKQLNLKPFIKKGVQYLYMKIIHKKNTNNGVNKIFYIQDNAIKGINENIVTYSNRFIKKSKRGKIIDRNANSLPRLCVIKGDDKHILPGDLFPLYHTKNKPKHYVKDIFIVQDTTSFKFFPFLKLRSNNSNTNGYIEISYVASANNPIHLKNKFIKRQNAWIYAPDLRHYMPDNPGNYDDSSLTSGYYSGKSWQNYFPKPGKTRSFVMDREHLIYRYGSSLETKELFYNKGHSSLRTGQIVLLDQANSVTHELVFDQIYQGLTPSNYPITGIRIITENESTKLIRLGQNNDTHVFVDSQRIKPGQSIPITNGQYISLGQYKFQVELEGNGVLASDSENQTHRYYPPGLGLSHTVGHFYKTWHGLESEFDAILKKEGKVQLTIDDDLNRIVRNEVQREIKLIDKKRRYQILTLHQLIKNEKNPYVIKRLQKQLDIQIDLQIKGALIVLSEKGEILSSVSEPSVLINKEALRHAYLQAKYSPHDSQLINYSIHEPQWSPGSSMKVITAAAAYEHRNNNQYIDKFLSIEPPFKNKYFGSNSSCLSRMSLPNKKAITTQLCNHHNQPIDFSMKSLPGALAKSYNVYFGYLALLLNKTIMYDSNSIQKKNIFWYRVFTDAQNRYKDNPLAEVANRFGYNQYMNLMPGTINGIHQNILPDRSITNFLTTIPGIFPRAIYSQTELTRIAIGQSQVKSTPLIGALTAMTIALKGQKVLPALIRNVCIRQPDNSMKTIYQLYSSTQKIVQTSTANEIEKGMQWVVNGKRPRQTTWYPNSKRLIYGTATKTFDDSLLKNFIYGKTGTSETGEDGVEGNSWFICYIRLPNNQTYALAAVFPNSGSGNRHAGECIKRVLNKMKRYYQWH